MKISTNLNQKGIAHPTMLVLIALVIGTVGLTSFVVVKNNSANRESSQTASQTEAEKSEDLNKLEAVEEENDEVEVPKEEKLVAPVPVEKKTDTSNPDKKDKVYLSMSLVSAVQQGNIVKVHSRVQSPVTGTCNFKLYREGFDKVYSTSTISNSQDCIGQLNVSSMPNYEGWNLHVWFDGSDGKTFAYQDAKPFALTSPN